MWWRAREKWCTFERVSIVVWNNSNANIARTETKNIFALDGCVCVAYVRASCCLLVLAMLFSLDLIMNNVYGIWRVFQFMFNVNHPKCVFSLSLSHALFATRSLAHSSEVWFRVACKHIIYLTSPVPTNERMAVTRPIFHVPNVFLFLWASHSRVFNDDGCETGARRVNKFKIITWERYAHLINKVQARLSCSGCCWRRGWSDAAFEMVCTFRICQIPIAALIEIDNIGNIMIRLHCVASVYWIQFRQFNSRAKTLF